MRERAKIVDMVGLSCCALWIGLSIWEALHGAGPMFARLGALGTAIAVGYFAMIRHSLPYPVGLHERLQLISERMNSESQNSLQHFQRRTIMALEIRNIFILLGTQIPSAIEKLSSENILDYMAKNPELPVSEWNELTANTVRESLAADQQVSLVAARSGRLQALIAVVSTLQWGFGDILFEKATTC